MLLGIFCVFDSKAVNFGQPFFTLNRGSALRGIQMQMRQDPKSMLAQYPSDFSVYDLGTYDDEKGSFHVNQPVFVMNVSDLVEAKNEQQP